MVFSKFLGGYFFVGRTPTGRKWQFSDFLAIREILGPGGKHEKHNFPVLGALLCRKKGYHAFGDGFPQRSRDFFLVGPPPTRNSDSVGFWPMLGLWHLDKSSTGWKTRKHNFLVLGALLWRKKCYHAIGDGFPQLSWEKPSFWPAPHRQGIAI